MTKRDDSLNKGYRIQTGDLIKLGRVEFRVVSLNGVAFEEGNGFDSVVNNSVLTISH